MSDWAYCSVNERKGRNSWDRGYLWAIWDEMKAE